jgi:hypothetical protein
MSKPASSFTVDDIQNATAGPDSGNRYEICQVSGFKAKAGGLVKRWDGMMVLPEYTEPRHPQDFIKSTPDHIEGAQRPEAADVFVSTSTAPSDL